jgi:glycosyltransferase involved in cell wall biosynthesis
VAELFDDTPAMRVVDRGPAAWAEALRSTAASTQLRDGMRRAALEYARRQLAGWREVLEEDLFSLWCEAAQAPAPAELIA